MPIISKPLVPVEVDYLCDTCGVSTVQRKNKLEPVSDEGFEYVCSNCDSTIRLKGSFPEIHYVPFYGFVKDAQRVVEELKNEQ